MSTGQKKISSTEKSCEQVVQRKSLVARYKVSLRFVVCERVVRFKMFPSRVFNEQKCPQEKKFKQVRLWFFKFPICRLKQSPRNIDDLSTSRNQSPTNLSYRNSGFALVPQIGHNGLACRRRAIKNLRLLPRDKINETHWTFLTHTPPAFLQASVMASLQPSLAL